MALPATKPTLPPAAPGLLRRSSDLLLAVGLMGMLLVMLVPLPPLLLDLAITANLAAALLVLLITLTVKEPLEFSTFPSLLLFTTLFRLALNVASTRLILMNGQAGRVIQSFGDFVVGGNLTIGLVIFLILLIIQFVVITKGSNRISEVAARFTLDAMPGKQMAIDADLNAGLVTEDVARKRREAIAAEAEFYGAMDGAGKFVRGDAVAGLIITVVNIIGGVAIGISRDLAVGDALRKYSVLTVGDGLVSQIPALLIAVAAGILVTKSRSQEKLSSELASQLLLSPPVLRLAAAMLFAFGLVPGLPFLPFALLAGGLFAAAVAAAKAKRRADAPAAEMERPEPETARELTPEALNEMLRVDRMCVEIGYRLIPLVNESARGNLLDHIAMVRKQFAQHYGFVVPPIRLRDNLTLEPNRYRILIAGSEVGRGELYPDHVLAMNPGQVREPVPGIRTKDPTFGLPAVWVPVPHKAEAETLGYTVVDPESVLVTHLTEIIKEHAHEILSREDVQAALDRIKETNATVVAELVPEVLTAGGVQRVLANLLRERVPIRNLPTILESLADAARKDKDPDHLTEAVRQRLSRTLCELHAAPSGRIEALTLAPHAEQALLEAITPGAEGGGSAAAALQQIQEAVLRRWQEAQAAGREPVLVVRAPLRRHLAELFRGQKPPLPVLSYAEILSASGVDSVGIVQPPAPTPPLVREAQGATV